MAITNIKGDLNVVGGVYRVDGTAIGATPETGYGVYINDGTTGSPQVISNGTEAVLSNNAVVRNDTSASTPNYLPPDVTSFYDEAQNLILPSSLGDSLRVAINFELANSAANGEFSLKLDISAAKDGSNIIGRIPVNMIRGAGVFADYDFVLDKFVGANFLANGGQLRIRADNGNVSVGRVVYKILRDQKGTP